MEILYVVELDVRANNKNPEDPVDVRGILVDHLADWLSFGHTPAIQPSQFDTQGDLSLQLEQGDGPESRISWRVEGTAETNALIVTRRTEIAKSSRADFLCVTTILQNGADIAVRFELGRESRNDVLAPAGIDFFRRPHILAKVIRDPRLECRVGSSLVDGRFNWVNPKHVDYVWSDGICAPGRSLPILLVDAATESGQQLAWSAANELAGLAIVLAVDGRARQQMVDRLAPIGAQIPEHGARLVWPDLTLRHPAFLSDETASTVERSLRLLSNVSVTVRGVNRLARRAVSAQRAAAQRQINSEIAEAEAQGDLAKELEAKTRSIEQLRSEIADYTAWFEEVEAERDEYRRQAQDAAYWKFEAERLRKAHPAPTSLGFDEAPDLATDDLSRLADFLSQRSHGAIAFTDRALASWKKSPYPHASEMRDALVKLAEAAVEYRRVNAQLGALPDDWFKQLWGLTLASTDKYMEKNRLDCFVYEGQTYSRQPHLKLADHIAPNEVGRVYFAMDSAAKRFIVC